MSQSDLTAQLANALISLAAWAERQCDLTVKKANKVKQIQDAQRAIEEWTRHNELRPGGQE